MKKQMVAGIASAAITCALALGLSACAAPPKTADVSTQTQAAVFAQSQETLPQGDFAAQASFPDWAGYVDDTLAMNSQYSFDGYAHQGTMYVSVADGVESFKLYLNNQEIDTSQMSAGTTTKVDISNATITGKNTVQVTTITPSDIEKGITISIPFPTVDQGSLEDAHISQASLDLISDVINNDIKHGFTSAQLAIIKDGKLVYQNAWGKTNSYNPDGTPKTDAADVTNDTLYDLASNTKMYATNYALQYLVTHENFNLDQKISDIIGSEFVDDTIDITYEKYDHVDLATNKQWKSELTVRDILRHQAGFPADPQYHNDHFNQSIQKTDASAINPLYAGSDATPETRAKTLEQICRTPLMYEPGSKTVYSDVDFMLLSFIIEKTTGKNFDDFLQETFWQPMNLTHITFNPLDHGFSKDDIAATELNGNTRDGAVNFTGVRHDTIQGQVHDEKAYYAMGGISGHAGLFANATDLAKFASVMLTGGYGNKNYFSRNVLDTFSAPKREDKKSATWGLGWWREADHGRDWYFGTQASSDTIGHQGWTGTLTMINPDENLVVVYLTNKINSPVTDKETDPNTFNGNWYTSSTLGFVPQLINMGLDADNSQVSRAQLPLLADMVQDKVRLIAEEASESKTTFTADSAIVQSAYALVETLFDQVESQGEKNDWELCKHALELFDDQRDADEIASLSDRIPQELR